MNPFTILGAKIFAGVSLALIIACAILYWMLSNAWGTIDDQRTHIAELEAAAAVQNAAITRLHDQGVQQKQAFDQAVQQGHDAIAQAQPRIRVVRQTAANGCRTPDVIMGAGL